MQLTDRAADEARWTEWLVRAQAGDREAYGRLLGELTDVIRAYLLSRFGRLELLDDCVQESLLALHLARHTYDPQRPFRPWLFAIVRNRTIDQLRRQPQHLGSEHEVQPERGQSQNPDHAIDAGRLLVRLSAPLKETLILTKILGYSIKECARRQGVSETVVKVRVHRGLRKLQSLCELETGLD